MPGSPGGMRRAAERAAPRARPVALRKARGLSQSQLAKILHVSQPRIAKIESGDVNNMELKTLVRYSAALGARIKVEFPDGRPKERAAPRL